LDLKTTPVDRCWLHYRPVEDEALSRSYRQWCSRIICTLPVEEKTPVLAELVAGVKQLVAVEPEVTAHPDGRQGMLLGLMGSAPFIDELVTPEETARMNGEGFLLKTVFQPGPLLLLTAHTEQGLLYAVFTFLRLIQTGRSLDRLQMVETPKNLLRMINHWDNLDGSVERGYAGGSIFFQNNELTADLDRVREYARLLASIGINRIVINNVNVHTEETKLIATRLAMVEKLASIFRPYGIKLLLSINYASPMEIGGLPTADPLDPQVRDWWRQRVEVIYGRIPDFGGFLVKADSEYRPGPFTYQRNHAEGANMLAEALAPYGGVVIWRCFVYNCQQDWRDRTTDRARAAYDHFQPLDGAFASNVILQIKNGPMDFQVREPVSPLFGAMSATNQLLELQITQEYTGQQIDLCYLAPQWKEVLDFDTYARGKGSSVKRIVDGSLFQRPYAGIAGVANVGDDPNWTGHPLAQANLFAFGRLCWNPDLTAEEITEEWVKATFGSDPEVSTTLSRMLLSSWRIYENYTAPLGIGWMVNPGFHYGPNVDGYEYSQWGTYHRADWQGIGVDRTMASGTGYTGQYFPENARRYEDVATCPDELILFFHHLPYTHQLKDGKTIIQHIYDTHFEGVEQVKELIQNWGRLKGKVDEERFRQVEERLNKQLVAAEEWRDVINTYFYRKTGIPDQHRRTIYS
jgi:alpha-glucuronidase